MLVGRLCYSQSWSSTGYTFIYPCIASASWNVKYWNTWNIKYPEPSQKPLRAFGKPPHRTYRIYTLYNFARPRAGIPLALPLKTESTRLSLSLSSFSSSTSNGWRSHTTKSTLNKFTQDNPFSWPSPPNRQPLVFSIAACVRSPSFQLSLPSQNAFGFSVCSILHIGLRLPFLLQFPFISLLCCCTDGI